MEFKVLRHTHQRWRLLLTTLAASCRVPDQPSSGLSTRGQAGWPSQLIKLLVAEVDSSEPYVDGRPVSTALWLMRAVPRVWLTGGERLGIQHVPLSNGARVGFSIEASSTSFKVNVTLCARADRRGATTFEWPSGGVFLRLRSPSWPQWAIVHAMVGGQLWPHEYVNATAETVFFPHAPADPTAMQNIVVSLAAPSTAVEMH